MSRSIDERVVAASFENAKFERAVAQTLQTLAKLDTALINIGKSAGLKNLETEASKITFSGPMNALDKLKGKFGGDISAGAFTKIEHESSKVTLNGPISALERLKSKFTFGNVAETAFAGLTKAAQGAFWAIEKAASHVTLQGLARTLGKIGSLFSFPEANKAFSEIERQSNNVTLSGVTKAVDAASHQFSLLEGAAAVAFGNILTKAAAMGGGLVKQITTGPIAGGFQEYATNLNSIQTILANTASAGTNVGDVNKALDELNAYADQTIYNFGQMAENAGKFTSAGVDLKTSVSSIKGLANIAALSGSNSEKASNAMYQLSQAIASGKVGVQDWNSVVQADMGGAQFQKALAETAVATGELSRDAVTYEGAMKTIKVHGTSFRESIMSLPGAPPAWLTSDVLTTTLAVMTGDLTDLQLKAKGYSDEQIKAIQLTARNAKLAATEVKTISGVFDVAKEAIGSGWSTTFRLIFGDFVEAKRLFTDLSQFVGKFINSQADARNAIIETWKKLGGRTDIIEGVKSLFEGILTVIEPIKVAFREIFPKKTGEDLADLSKKFRELMDQFRLGPEGQDKLFRSFQGLFALLKIGVGVVKEVGGMIVRLFRGISGESGGFTEFVAQVGDFVTRMEDALIEGGLLHSWFTGLGDMLRAPLKILQAVGAAIVSIFDGTDRSISSAFTDSIGDMGDKMGPVKKIVDLFVEGWDKLVDVFNRLTEAVEPALHQAAEQIGAFSDIVADSFQNANWDTVFQVIETSFLGGIFVAIKKGLTNGLGVNIGGDVLDSVSESLKAVTGNLTALQQNVKAATILEIAGAIVLLAFGVGKLAKINPGELSKAMTAMSVGLGELIGAMALLSKAAGSTWSSAGKLPIFAGSLVIVAAAIVVMAKAVQMFAELDWEGVIKGLTGVMGVVAIMANIPPGTGKGLISLGLALIPLGVGMMGISIAVKMLAGLDWVELARGLAGLLFSLVAIAATVPEMALMIPAGLGMIAMATGMVILASAIGVMGSLDLLTLVKGIVGIAAALFTIGLAMWAFPPPPMMLAASLGMLILGAGLTGITTAVAILGHLNLGALVKGIVALSVLLAVMAESMYMMIGTLPGAAALIVAAGAIAILAPSIALLGNLKWSTIFKGLAAVAFALSTLAIFGLLAAPAMAAVGIALIPLGLGMILAGAGAKMLADAFVKLGTVGEAGITAAVAAIGTLVYLLPRMIIDFLKGLVQVVDLAVKIFPKVAQALGLIILELLDSIIKIIPKLTVAITDLIQGLIELIMQNLPQLIAAGANIVIMIVTGLQSKIGELTIAAVGVVVNFLNALRSKMPELAQAGSDTLVAWLNAIKEHIPEVTKAASEVMALFIVEFGKHEARIIEAGSKVIGHILAAFVLMYPQIVETAAEVILKFITGISSKGPKLVKAAVDAAGKFLNALSKELLRLTDMGAQAMIDFLNGLADSIRTKGPELRAAGYNVADAMLDGMRDAFLELGPKVGEVLGKVVKLLPKAVKLALGIHSPSRVFHEIGGFIVQGLAEGIDDESTTAKKSSEGVSNTVIGAFKDIFQIHSPSEVMKEIGMQVGKGFSEGIRGSEDDIKNAFSSLNQKLGEAIRNSREGIKSEQDKLQDLYQQHADKMAEIARLRLEKKPDQGEINQALNDVRDIETAIQESEKTLASNERVLTKSLETRKLLMQSLKDEKGHMLALSKEYADVTKKLDEQQTALDNIIKERADFAKTTSDQFGTAPAFDLEAQDPIADFKQKLAVRIAEVKKYQETLAKLRAIGLDDTTYRKFLSDGTVDQKLADQLLAGGKGAVDQLTALDAQLKAEADKLGDQAAHALYDAGVNTAQGLVDGLTAKKAELEKIMNDLADSMVRTLKAKLKIKSPSKVFEALGKFTAEGLAVGINGATRGVTDAAANLGSAAISAMQSTLSGVSDAINDNMDVNPVITPVLDLTKVQKGAKQLDGLTNVVPITAAASYGQASAISVERAQSDATQAADAPTPALTFDYTQNNYSPESLSDVEIYRQTNNQLSHVKRSLGMSV